MKKSPRARAPTGPARTRSTVNAIKPKAAAPAPTAPLRRISKGRRPQFYDDVAVDQLFAVVTALTAELSTAFDRIDTLERVLTAAGAVTAAGIEAYRPSTAAAAERAVGREELIQRVFSVFESYAARPER